MKIGNAWKFVIDEEILVADHAEGGKMILVITDTEEFILHALGPYEKILSLTKKPVTFEKIQKSLSALKDFSPKADDIQYMVGTLWSLGVLDCKEEKRPTLQKWIRGAPVPAIADIRYASKPSTKGSRMLKRIRIDAPSSEHKLMYNISCSSSCT